MKKTFMKLTSALFLAVMALWSVDAQAGCNDATACNYVSTDTDAVDCLFYTISVGGGSFESEMSWDIEDGTGTVIYSGFAPETVCADFPDDCYTLNLYDSFGDGWNGGTMIITDATGTQLVNTTFTTGTQSIQFWNLGAPPCIAPGCTDPGACNYDSTANEEDGSCEYVTCAGCTNPDYCEFDSTATISDFAQCLTFVGCFDTTSCLFDPLAACGDQVALCTQVANDTCGGAIDLGVLTGTQTIAINNFNTCVDELTSNGETNGVWYQFTTPAGPFTLDIVNDNVNFWDTEVEILDACGALTIANGYADFGGLGGGFALSFGCDELATSTTYWMMIDSWNGSNQGSGDLTITVDEVFCITGCTNPLAANFCSACLIDDGSCIVPDCAPDPGVNTVFCYGPNEDISMSWSATNPGDQIVFMFSQGTIENSIFDELTIYDGLSTADPVLFSNAGLGTGDYEFIVESTSGSLTMTFTSDGSVQCTTSTTYLPWDYTVFCGTQVFPGCMDTNALNYDSTATIDNGTCVTPDCAPTTPVNYTYCYDNNLLGEVVYAWDGMGDQVIVNFLDGTLESSTFDVINIYDGVYPDNSTIAWTNSGLGTVQLEDEVGYIESTNGGIWIEFVQSDGSVSCQTSFYDVWSIDVYCGEQIILGCTDVNACNYDSGADVDDGSCCLENCVAVETTGTAFNNFDIFFFVEGSDGTEYLFVPNFGGVPSYDELCLPDDCYTIRMLSAGGAGWDGGILNVYDGTGAVIYTSDFASGDGDGGYLSNHVFSVGSVPCETCQDLNACNYDDTGIYEDCSLCEYTSCAGCTYAFSPNYDPAASVDDGSCLEPEVCAGDANGDGSVNVLDLVAVSSNFGSNC